MIQIFAMYKILNLQNKMDVKYLFSFFSKSFLEISIINYSKIGLKSDTFGILELVSPAVLVFLIWRLANEKKLVLKSLSKYFALWCYNKYSLEDSWKIIFNQNKDISIIFSLILAIFFKNYSHIFYRNYNCFFNFFQNSGVSCHNIEFSYH